MVRLVKRQPPGRPSLGASHQFDRGAKREGARDLIAGRLLATRDLGVRGALARASKQAPTEPARYSLPRRQLLMPLRERVHTDATAKATLAPDQEGTPAGNRQIAHPHQRALLHLATPLPAARAATTGRDELDLEVELITPLRDRRHDEPLESEERAKLLVHPLFLPAPRSMTTQKLARAADVSSYALNPARSARPELCSSLSLFSRDFAHAPSAVRPSPCTLSRRARCVGQVPEA